MNRPNILFIHNDHQAFTQWDAYDVKPARPHFDSIAKEGVTFTNAYCASPLCGPMRRTLLSGVYAHTHKMYYNYTDPLYNEEVYLNTLADAGYQNFYYGKWHAGFGDARDFQTEGFTHTSYGNPYVRDSYKRYMMAKGLPEAEFEIRYALGAQSFGYGDPDSLYPDLVEGNKHYKSKEPNYCGEHAAGITVTPVETTESHFLASLACDKLEELAARPEGSAPFALRVDFWGPHQPYFPTQEYFDLYKDAEWPPYPSFDSDLSTKPKSYHRERNLPLNDGKDQIVYPSKVGWSYFNDLMRYCAAQITMVDAAAGKILEKLRTLGLDDNTLVIYSTDHGDSLATHGGHFDKASFMSQEMMRVPMAMSWKGRIPPGTVCERPVCSVSTPVTILDAAGLRFSHKPHGGSLLPLADGREVDWPDYAVSETAGHGFGEYITSRAIVWGQYKYVATVGDENIDELYDLAADPYEMNNRHGDPALQKVLCDIRGKLLEWQRNTDDPVVFSWAE